MAKFPQGLTNIRERGRLQAGERKVLEALHKHLEDDYTVWHNITILETQRHPDFVILHPSRGILIIEVKDYRKATLIDANPMSVTLSIAGQRVVQEDHPLSQAKGYAFDIVDMLKKFPELVQNEGRYLGKLKFPWGFGVVFTRIKKSEIASDPCAEMIFPERKTLFAEDLSEDVDSLDFSERLWGMFDVDVDWSAQLTLPQLQLVRGILFPELRFGMNPAVSVRRHKTLPAEVIAELMKVMDQQQEEVARTIGDGHRVIHGPAGSGKTMILIYRAEQLRAQATVDKPVLVLCYNRALASKIESILRLKGVGSEVQVDTFHGWVEELMRTYQLSVPPGRYESNDARADATCDVLKLAHGRIPPEQYTGILIDEAHDLKDEWLATAVRMVNSETQSLLVMYDSSQSLYASRRKSSFAKLGIQAQGRTRILRVNYRNTSEILAVAMQCATELIEQTQSRHETDPEEEASAASDDSVVHAIKPESAGRTGPMPQFFLYENVQQQAIAIAKYLHERHESGVPWSGMAILGRSRKLLELLESGLKPGQVPFESQAHGNKRDMSWDQETVKLLTMHSSKGLEFECVVIAGIDEMYGEWFDELKLLYVAMTRSTHTLLLTAAKPTPLTERVAQAVAAVTATHLQA